MTRAIYVPGIGRHVSLGAYIAGIRRAKANPHTTFAHGLTTWAPCTGEEIMRQFRRGMHDRINQGIPYIQRGKE